jgi:flagellar hook-basal body complex protein FliE
MPAYGLTPRMDIAPAEMAPLPMQRPEGATSAQPSGDSFASTLSRMFDEVNQKQEEAADVANKLQSGGDISLHQAVIALEEANVSFQLMVEVRNKLLEAYQEIMRMQV